MKKETRLYNVLFPLWMLMLFPITWLIILPGNFIIDSIVLVVCMFALKIENKKQMYKSCILKIFLFGLLADAVGALYMIIMMFCFEVGNMGDELYLTLPALIISAVLIFVLNYFVTFKKYDKKLRLRTSLAFALATAPYTFLYPSRWLYGF